MASLQKLRFPTQSPHKTTGGEITGDDNQVADTVSLSNSVTNNYGRKVDTARNECGTDMYLLIGEQERVATSRFSFLSIR